MINVSRAFRRELAKNNRNYLTYAMITLADGSQTVLSLCDEEMWVGGFSRETAVSEDDSFTALGATIIGSASITINNIDEQFSDYDFKDAQVDLSLGLMVDGSIEQIRTGTYYVDETMYNGSTITLEMLDAMHKFDQPYVFSPLKYPATIGEIIRDACTECEVTLTTQNFPHRDYVIAKRPEDESITYREVLGWATAIAGCFARINNLGYLEIKWFDQATLETWNEGWDGGSFDSSKPYSTGDSAEGGSFNPWNAGTAYDGEDFQVEKAMHVISGLYSQSISMDDVVITGVLITVKNDNEDELNETLDYMGGEPGYIVKIEGNELLTPANGQEVATWLGAQLAGLRFRKASVTHANDPSIEAGDIAVLYDRKDRPHPILVTRSNFSVGNVQTTVCGAETPLRNQAKRYSWETKNFVSARKMAKEQMTAWETAQAALSERIDKAAGLFCTPKTDSATGATRLYYHDKADLDDSNIVMLFTNAGFTITNNYQKGSQANWYGLTVDGTLISSILNSVGVNADWIRTGTLDANKATVINLNASNIMTGTMSADKIDGGTLTLGGASGVLGILKIFNAVNTLLAYSDVEGLKTINGGSFASLGDSTFTQSDQNASVLRNSAFEMGWLSSGTSINSSNFHTNGKMRLIRDDNSIAQVKDVTRVDLSFNRPESEMLTLGYYDNNGTPVPMLILQTLSDSYSQEDQRYPIYDTKSGTAIAHYTPIVLTRNTGIDGALHVKGNFYVYGNDKNRVIETPDYGTRLQYAYETAAPYFGDIGSAKTDEQGSCYVFLDDILRETINPNHEYAVFLQKEGKGDIWISEKTADYFVVQGTPNLAFSWELKAKQIDHTDTRLELLPNEEIEDIDYAAEGAALVGEDIDYAAEAAAMVDDYFNIAEV